MQDQEKLKELIQHYLRDAKMMQLATVADGKPWVCNVWFAADDELNIYWFSSVTRRHSQEVARESSVAAAICLPQTPEDPPRGLQVEGTAEVLESESDVTKAMSLYVGRIFSQEQVDTFMQHPERPHKFYHLRPTNFVLFDVANFPENPRQEFIVE